MRVRACVFASVHACAFACACVRMCVCVCSAAHRSCRSLPTSPASKSHCHCRRFITSPSSRPAPVVEVAPPSSPQTPSPQCRNRALRTTTATALQRSRHGSRLWQPSLDRLQETHLGAHVDRLCSSRTSTTSSSTNTRITVASRATGTSRPLRSTSVRNIAIIIGARRTRPTNRTSAQPSSSHETRRTLPATDAEQAKCLGSAPTARCAARSPVARHRKPTPSTVW